MSWLAVIFPGLLPLIAFSQKYATEKSLVTFYSDAVIEDIRAENTKTASIFDEATGQIAFSVPVREFQFRKSLMQEHFKEKYMESHLLPKGQFVGTLSSYTRTATGVQSVTADGKLTIHGVTREVAFPGTVERQNSTYIMKSKFMIKLEDNDIEIPTLVGQNIAEEVEVTVEVVYTPQKVASANQ